MVQHLPSLEENTYLCKAINEEIKRTNLWWIANLKYILNWHELCNLMINIFKVVAGDYKKKRKRTTKTNIISFTKKKIKTVNFFIFVSGRWISLHRLKTNIKRKLIWTLKAVIVAITKLTLSSHNLTISTAKSYILHNNQKICWYWLRNNIENVIHVLFDCDNYYTLW